MTAQRLEILHRDDDIVVVLKPSGLLSVASPGASGTTVVEALRRMGVSALPVHRLDRDVSGVMVLGRHEGARATLENAFRARSVEKLYWALAQGRVKPASGTFDWPIEDRGADAAVSARGKPAVTKFRTLSHAGPCTELEIDLLTGRYNQIRLHFAHARFPLVGERKYAFGRDAVVKFKRVALHAMTLALPHPTSGARLSWTAPLPSDLAELMERLRSTAPGR